MNTNDIQQELQQQLNLQHHKSQQLLTLLEQENQALIARDIEKILALATDKQQLLQHLSDADQQIQQLIAPSTELPPQFNDLKESILKNIAQSQQQNEINGKAIALSIGSIERLQHAMIKKRAGNSMTYNEKGKTRGSGPRGGYISV